MTPALSRVKIQKFRDDPSPLLYLYYDLSSFLLGCVLRQFRSVTHTLGEAVDTYEVGGPFVSSVVYRYYTENWTRIKKWVENGKTMFSELFVPWHFIIISFIEHEVKNEECLFFQTGS